MGVSSAIRGFVGRSILGGGGKPPLLSLRVWARWYRLRRSPYLEEEEAGGGARLRIVERYRTVDRIPWICCRCRQSWHASSVTPPSTYLTIRPRKMLSLRSRLGPLSPTGRENARRARQAGARNSAGVRWHPE